MRTDNYLHEKLATDFDAIRLGIASPENILDWSHGEVTKPETVNYRTQKPEKDGLFDERIFGPSKDFECYCGKYKGAHYRGTTCDRCGVLVARSIVRRERMGHITLAAPATHTWFLRGVPSTVGLILDMTAKNLEKVAYFASYVITKVDEDKKEEAYKELEAKYEQDKGQVKQKYEALAEDEKADVKALAKQQTEELDNLETEYQTKRSQLDSLVFKNVVSENDYGDINSAYGSVFEAMIGAEAVEHLLSLIDVDETIEELKKLSEETQGQRKVKILKRLKKFESMQKAGISPTWMVLRHVPVIPPELRPMVQLTGGRFATSDLNDLYRRVINRNNRLKKLVDLNAPAVIRRNEMRMLQEAVDTLIDNSHARGGRAVSATGGRRKLKSLSDQLRGKQGRFRQNLLGKRVDYSGRSVIVAGPDLNIDECGLPKMMALELFKPFVIGKLIEREAAHNVKAAGQMIESGDPLVWDALDEVIEGKYVLLNRAPTLHRLGVQAFRPKLIEGKAIQLHPLVCSGFNADFDGDMMAVHLPLSNESQKEAREIMAASKNLLYPSDGSVIVYIAQDMILGAYYMTYDRYDMSDVKYTFADIHEAEHAYDNGVIDMQTPINALIEGEVITTTIGRILFNEILPEEMPFVNKTFDKDAINELTGEVFEKYGMPVLGEVADRIKTIGYEYATVSGLSTGMDDYIIPESKDAILEEGEARASEVSEQYQQGLITEEERFRLTVSNWLDINEKLQGAVESSFAEQNNSTTITVVSKARAKLSAVSQIIGMIGLRQDVYGNIIELPIKSNYKEGLTSVEYFIDARGSRKGLVDTALKTADSGYLTRRLVDVAQDAFTIEDDCGDRDGIIIDRHETEEIGGDLAYRLAGRIAAENIGKFVKAGELISKEAAAEIVASDIDQVKIRSLLTCQSVRGVCRDCYGVDLSTGQMVGLRVPVGVMAAQAIGEPGTQLTLRTFHGGGAAGDDITQGLPRVEELFEARNPKGLAQIADIGGTVHISEKENHYKVRISPEGDATSSHSLKSMIAMVKDGQEVEAGDVVVASPDYKKTVTSTIKGIAKVLKTKVVIKGEKVGATEYTIPRYKSLLVKDGDKVTAGQQLIVGSVNLQDLLKLTGTSEVQRHVMNEVQKVFTLQGAGISDKHLETIIRQMTSRVQVEDSGDSLFVSGDVVARSTVIEENQKLSQDGKQPITYKQLLLGISKASLSTDSWLSAASFQDTTRVLINAATSGSTDRLYGLKENVIIGRKIPVGTGYVPEVEAEEADPVADLETQGVEA